MNQQIQQQQIQQILNIQQMQQETSKGSQTPVPSPIPPVNIGLESQFTPQQLQLLHSQFISQQMQSLPSQSNVQSQLQTIQLSQATQEQ